MSKVYVVIIQNRDGYSGIEVFDSKEAAEKYAEHANPWDYVIMGKEVREDLKWINGNPRKKNWNH